MSDVAVKLEAVVDEETFVAFLNALEIDFNRNSGEWQNTSIGPFLECAAAWAQDTKGGVNDYVVPKNPWKRAAEIIYCGKIYE